MAVGVGVAGPQLGGATGVRADERLCRDDAVRSHVGHLFSATDSASGGSPGNCCNKYGCVAKMISNCYRLRGSNTLKEYVFVIMR